MIIRRYFDNSLRVSLLITAAFLGGWLTLITELLSYFHSFSFAPVVIAWSLIFLISLFFVLPHFKEDYASLNLRIQNLKLNDKFLLILTGLILVITGLTALVSMPNNSDSMTYHLARVEHWIQDQSISYYPTHILHQLYFCPWAEFTLAHLKILSAYEPIVNFLQWLAMAGSLIVLSLIVKQFGGSYRAQIITCLMAACLPMGILQSVTTQNDYIEAFWFLSFLFFLRELITNEKNIYLVTAGLCLGLALLTKAYSYFLIVPFILWYSIITIQSGQIKKFIKSFLVIAVMALILNAAYYERNMSAFGTLLTGKEKLTNSDINGKIVIGNILRNIASEIDTPIYQLNYDATKAIGRGAKLVGIDFNNTTAQYNNNSFYVPDFLRKEDSTGDFLHLIVFIIIAFLCCFLRIPARGLRVYMLLIFCSGLLFCSVLRYQPWITRFHILFFLLFCPIAGIFLDRTCHQRALNIIGFMFFLGATPFLFLQNHHPWFGKSTIWNSSLKDQLFINRKYKENFTGMAHQIEGLNCHDIGIITSHETWEYPLWYLLKKDQPAMPWRFEHVYVDNISSGFSYPLGDFNPCALARIEEKTQPINYLLPKGQFQEIWKFSNSEGFETAVYKKTGTH